MTEKQYSFSTITIDVEEKRVYISALNIMMEIFCVSVSGVEEVEHSEKTWEYIRHVLF